KSQPIANSWPVARDSNGIDRGLCWLCLRWMQGFGTLKPPENIWYLWVCDESLNPYLLPFQCSPVRKGTPSRDRSSIQTLLEAGHIVNRDDPAHPATAHTRPGADSLPEWCLFGGRVFEHSHYRKLVTVSHPEKLITSHD